MPIKRLDEQTISRIAAGEVVERPASAVKELIENSLDAGATQVSVEVAGGGTALIRVTDNGSGIPAGEVALAFERHATSKITRIDDLESIATLGFRGEALPSIAAVAEVELLTCAEGEGAGSRIILDNGAVTGQSAAGRNRGTTVTVRHLFRKVPARLKFLRSPNAESGRVIETVSQFALAYPEVAFTLAVDGKTSLRTPGSGRLIDALIEVYGVAAASRMLEIKSEPWGANARTVRVSGFAGPPDLARARPAVSLFVNRRWVNSRVLSRAVEEAYQGLLMVGKRPLAVVNITVPPDQIDVNVHPAKSEVKFQDEPAVFTTVQRAMRRTLVEQAPVPRIEELAPPYRPPLPMPPPRHIPSEPTPPDAPQLGFRDSLPVLRLIGQARGCYLIAEGPDGVYLIDQHAAHERVLFEKVRCQRESRQVEVQGLLEPVPVEVDPVREAVLKGNIERLAGLGFSLEPFGGRTYLVRSVPAVLDQNGWRDAFDEVISSLSGTGDTDEAALRSIACHGAVRSGQSLSLEEMRGLLRELEQTENPHTCPHGRPTMIQLTWARMEKDFRRI